MSVTPIANQPIRFQNINEIDTSCDCLGQDFCQLINNNDPTQFQLKSTDQIVNGDFQTTLDGWEIFEAITVTVDITNESVEGQCDGQVDVSATGGSGGYTYSINGGAFGSSSNFDLLDLCAGTYLITVKDSNGNEGSIEIEIFTNVICSDYHGFTLQQMIDSGISLGQLYNCTLDDIQP